MCLIDRDASRRLGYECVTMTKRSADCSPRGLRNVQACGPEGYVSLITILFTGSKDAMESDSACSLWLSLSIRTAPDGQRI